ncbi:MAG: hypothetical protein R3F35_03790 [Myxococcota bacterium]
MLGAPTVLTCKFDAPRSTRSNAAVSVLAAVSTQFIMLLESGGFDGGRISRRGRSSPGGEAVPERQARNLELRTGASVLQFYGSNDGARSARRPSDPLTKRLYDRGTADRGDAVPVPSTRRGAT